jgi:hypothetical protein
MLTGIELLVVPTVKLPNVRLLTDTVTELIPLPFVVIVCGLSGALSVIVTDPL